MQKSNEYLYLLLKIGQDRLQTNISVHLPSEYLSTASLREYKTS